MTAAEVAEQRERVARGIANMLWRRVPTETLAEMVDHAHEQNDDGYQAHRTLWDAVLAHVYTTMAASAMGYVSFLHDDPQDKDESDG